jgi:hypothetical protein
MSGRNALAQLPQWKKTHLSGSSPSLLFTHVWVDANIRSKGGRGDPAKPQRLGERRHRRVDEAEIERLEATIQLGHTPVGFCWQIGDEVVALDDALVEDLAAGRPQALARQMVDLWKHGCWQEKPTLLVRDQRAGSFMPAIHQSPVLIAVPASRIISVPSSVTRLQGAAGLRS